MKQRERKICSYNTCFKLNKYTFFERKKKERIKKINFFEIYHVKLKEKIVFEYYKKKNYF